MLRLHEMELRNLRGKAPALAVVTSASAVTLAAASTQAQVEKFHADLTRIEQAQGFCPLARSQWKHGHTEFDAALQQLKVREVQR